MPSDFFSSERGGTRNIFTFDAFQEPCIIVLMNFDQKFHKVSIERAHFAIVR